MTTDLNYLKIETFSGINDSPIAPTTSKAGNGSHLIGQFNSLVSEVQTLAGSITPDNQKAIITSPYFMGFENINSIEEKYLSCGFNPDIAFKIQFPANTKNFVSQWGINLNSGNDDTLILSLVGKFNSETLVYRYDGIIPEGFNIAWYRGTKFGDTEDLNIAQPGHLNFSIVNSTKELHVYNTTEQWIDLLARITYSLILELS